MEWIVNYKMASFLLFPLTLREMNSLSDQYARYGWVRCCTE